MSFSKPRHRSQKPEKWTAAGADIPPLHGCTLMNSAPRYASHPTRTRTSPPPPRLLHCHCHHRPLAQTQPTYTLIANAIFPCDSTAKSPEGEGGCTSPTSSRGGSVVVVVMWLLSGYHHHHHHHHHFISHFQPLAYCVPLIRALDIHLPGYYGRVMHALRLFYSRRGTRPELFPGALRARSKPISRRPPRPATVSCHLGEVRDCPPGHTDRDSIIGSGTRSLSLLSVSHSFSPFEMVSWDGLHSPSSSTHLGR